MKKQNSLVSILVINFNNAKLITRAINSCLSQSYKKIALMNKHIRFKRKY